MRTAPLFFLASPFFVALAAPALAQTPSIKIDHPWARATLPHQSEGVAYLTMTSPAGDTLTSIDTPDAGMAMLHATIVDAGVSEMRDVDNLKLPPGVPVSLSPHGTHLMLMDMKHPLLTGQKLHLALHFLKAGTVELDAPVLPAGASGPTP
jgi:copper(I)-binding protein